MSQACASILHQIQTDHRSRQEQIEMHRRLLRQEIDKKFRTLRRRETLDKLPGGDCRSSGREVQLDDHRRPIQNEFPHRPSPV